MTPILVFDIETVPDVVGVRRLRPGWASMRDGELAQRLFDERREKTGSDFLPLHLHRVVAISCAFRDDQGFRVRSIGQPDDNEGRLIQAFFATVERYTPQLVSWNGGGFDLPVLHYRGLCHGVVAGRYWDTGRRRPRVPLQQLHQPLSPAPHRPDGPAGDVPAARQCAARRDGQAVRLSRQARHGRQRRSRRLSRRAASTRSAVTARPT